MAASNANLPGFSNISEPDDMVAFLQDMNRLQSDYVYQYTRLETIERIIESRKWKLNKPENMNDRYEYEMFRGYWHGKYYSCFMDTKNESVAMWAMYGQPWEDGIRIGIPKREFKKWIRNINIVEDESGSIIWNAKTYFASILYINDNPSEGIILGNNSKNTSFYPYDYKKKLAGYIKDKAWDYEKEVRIHVFAPDFYGDSVYVPIPDSLIESIAITTGPRFNETKHLTKLYGITGINTKIDNSKFRSKLHWVYCDDCEIKKKKSISPV